MVAILTPAQLFFQVRDSQLHFVDAALPVENQMLPRGRGFSFFPDLSLVFGNDGTVTSDLLADFFVGTHDRINALSAVSVDSSDPVCGSAAFVRRFKDRGPTKQVRATL
jgi:hypothetical protein